MLLSTSKKCGYIFSNFEGIMENRINQRKKDIQYRLNEEMPLYRHGSYLKWTAAKKDIE